MSMYALGKRCLRDVYRTEEPTQFNAGQPLSSYMYVNA